MAEFGSVHDYTTFANFIRRKSRHILDERNRKFLQVVLATGRRRTHRLPQNSVLWRAQEAHVMVPITVQGDGGELIEVDETEAPAPQKRMRPLPNRAKEGRVNPKGIPVWYFGTDMKTAMTEVPPWVGANISVGQFVTKRELKLIDCSIDASRRERTYLTHCEEPPPEQREKHVWWCINKAFSTPVTRNDDVADYAPTQVIAEMFHSEEYDGIRFQSNLGSGRNIAIFDLDAAQQATCYLFRASKVDFDFVSSGDPYCCGDFEKDARFSGLIHINGEQFSDGKEDVAATLPNKV
jgi:hypothetical protein